MTRRWVWHALLVPLVSAACASAPRPEAETTKRLIPVGNDVVLPAGEMLLTLPADQRFRFVSPDSIVRGNSTEDARSIRLAEARELRTSMAIVLRSRGWRESLDSADFDISVFITRRTYMRTETREENVPSTATSHLPRCDMSRMGNQPPCTNERDERTRIVRTQVPYTRTQTYHVMRRNSDGAVRWWRFEEAGVEQMKAVVAEQLLQLLFSPEG